LRFHKTAALQENAASGPRLPGNSFVLKWHTPPSAGIHTGSGVIRARKDPAPFRPL
jgi:hypothetical protein